MSEHAELTFAGLLRRLRTGAGLTQEELAGAATISPRSVSDLERGVSRTARKDTAVLLARAMKLTGEVAELFVAAATGRVRAGEVLAAIDRVGAASGHNLPAALTSFIGRKQELAEVMRLLGVARLVTLTGTGGVGKTRLAAEAAGGAVTRFADGVWLADLAGIGDAGMVPAAVMQSMGVRQEGGVPAMEALAFRLRSADLLLVLDNCEHLLEACTGLARALLRGAPGLRVLATSREPLGLPGEVVFLVRPLALPPQSADEDAIVEADAVRLFMDRGRAARGGTLGAVAPPGVAGRICRELDGLPLAIELAAARLTTLSAADIEAQLADRLMFLAYRRPVSDTRHQGLQTAVDWSYDLLTAPERELFDDLSVFAGSFALEQLAEVCVSGDQPVALALIDALAAKSLVICEPTADGSTRYRLLETIRHYAAARLAKSGDADAARRRHARAYLHLADCEPDPDVLSAELDNFRAALDWSLSCGDQIGPRLALASGDLWLALGLLQEGRGFLERALAHPVTEQRLRASLLRQLGAIEYEAGDLQNAEAIVTKAARAAESASTAAEQARIRLLLADIRACRGGDIAAAAADSRGARAVLEAEGDLVGLAEAWFLAGKLEAAPSAEQVVTFARAVDFARLSGHRYVAAQASLHLGIALWNSPVPAREYIPRYEQLLRDAGSDAWAEAHMLPELAGMYGCVGRFTEARAALARSQSLLTRYGARLLLAQSALVAGLIELAASDFPAAEMCFRQGHDELSAMGEQVYRSFLASYAAEAQYVQGRFDEAQQMSEDAQASAIPDDLQPQVLWKIIRAKLLARRGQILAARELMDEVVSAVRQPYVPPVIKAQVLAAQGEISRLARDPGAAGQHLRAALRIYEDIGLVPFADQIKAAIDGLAPPESSDP